MKIKDFEEGPVAVDLKIVDQIQRMSTTMKDCQKEAKHNDSQMSSIIEKENSKN